MKFDTRELRKVMSGELERRKLSPAAGDYAYRRASNECPLYGVTGAANLHAELGLDFGGFEARAAWRDRINSFQQPDGAFDSVSGPEHAAAMAVIALNLLGGRPARPVRHLAPLKPDALEAWLDRMNWDNSTHKEFCGGVAPILASGFYDGHWLRTLLQNVESRLDPARPMRIWSSREDDPPWRAISCMYHVLSAYDAGGIPYPAPQMLWNRLAALDYEHTRNERQRTACTDFDYGWMLLRLSVLMPEHFQETRRRCGEVLDMMIAEWREERERMLSATTHELYCQCIGWAIYRNILPERFQGPPLFDTLHAPWLYRLPSPEWLAQE